MFLIKSRFKSCFFVLYKSDRSRWDLPLYYSINYEGSWYDQITDFFIVEMYVVPTRKTVNFDEIS